MTPEENLEMHLSIFGFHSGLGKGYNEGFNSIYTILVL